MSLYKNILKPIFDVVIAIIGFLLLSPLFIVISIILFFLNEGSILFYQERPGKHEVIFRIMKFKTMNDKTDENGELLDPTMRITKIGKMLRKYSLDEIPQLLNVIKGDMSLIGPRPLLVRYLPRYNNFQKQRHNVKPGITGWAQVNGRNAISWEQKFELDVWYVNNISFLLDLKIIALTIYKVIKRTGINSVNDTIVPDFLGTQSETND